MDTDSLRDLCSKVVLVLAFFLVGCFSVDDSANESNPLVGPVTPASHAEASTLIRTTGGIDVPVSIDSYEMTVSYAVNEITESIDVHRQLDGGTWTFVENRNVTPSGSGVLYITHDGMPEQRAGVRLTPYGGTNGTGNEGIPQYRWDDVP